MAEENPDAVRLYLLRVIRDLHAEFDKGGYLMVREKVLGVLADLNKYRSEFMADKLDLVATLHGLLGNAYLEINDLDLALKHHHQDLCIGQKMKSISIASRALGNLGRTHIARKDFHTALECFAGKSKHASTSLEKAWLYQKIAYGYVQLKKYDQAHEHFTAAMEQTRLREEALMKASWEDEENPELAGLKESDTDSVQSQEQQVIQAASALAARSAKSANQPRPFSLTEDLPREKSEDLVPQQQALKAEDAEGVRVKALAALDSYTEEELQQEEYLPLVAKLHSFLG
ncbi:hypothetical protein ACOMHN_046741 [Nucella lapillus]